MVKGGVGSYAGKMLSADDDSDDDDERKKERKMMDKNAAVQVYVEFGKVEKDDEMDCGSKVIQKSIANKEMELKSLKRARAREREREKVKVTGINQKIDVRQKEAKNDRNSKRATIRSNRKENKKKER